MNDGGFAFFWSQISPLGVALGSEYAGDGSFIDINIPSPSPNPSPSASPKHNGGGNNDLGSADSLFANNWVAQVSEFFDF